MNTKVVEPLYHKEYTTRPVHHVYGFIYCACSKEMTYGWRMDRTVMPVRLTTTLSKISSVPNPTNACLLEELYAFMQTTGASESHCNNTLKTATAFAYFLGSTESFYDIRTRDKVIAYLDTKMVSSAENNAEIFYRRIETTAGAELS